MSKKKAKKKMNLRECKANTRFRIGISNEPFSRFMQLYMGFDEQVKCGPDRFYGIANIEFEEIGDVEVSGPTMSLTPDAV
jgi:hypothetical protein